jgi:phage shock protein PspC (stress-responsive transcriptional regulator)
MTETAATPPLDSPLPDSGPTTEPLFIRPREGRMLAGVCAGIAERWKLDITLVRIVAVAATLVSGIGVAVYLAAWLLTPSVDGPPALRSDSRAARIATRMPIVVLIVFGALVLAGLAHALWWGAPIGLLIAALVIALVVGTRRGRWTLVAVAALLAVGLTTVGVFGSHFGTRTYHVTSVSDLRSSYEYGAGKVNLDLSSMAVTGQHRTEIRLGRGDVVVTVPANAPILVHARSGLGSVTIDGHQVSGIDAEQAQFLGGQSPLGGVTATDSDRLVVDVLVGAGAVDVRTG